MRRMDFVLVLMGYSDIKKGKRNHPDHFKINQKARSIGLNLDQC